MPSRAKTDRRAADRTKRASASASKSGPVAATTLHPLGDRIVVRPIPGDVMTKSGIVIPDTAQEKPQEGLILAIGPGRMLDTGQREQMDLRSGDTVLYPTYSGTGFKLGGEDLLIISGRDILAVIDAGS